MTFVLRFILAALSVYRMAELISVDDGPYMIFKNLRKMLGVKASGKSEKSLSYNMALLFNCPYCLGIWISALFCIFVLIPSIPGDVILVFLGIAGVQTFLESLSGTRNTEK